MLIKYKGELYAPVKKENKKTLADSETPKPRPSLRIRRRPLMRPISRIRKSFTDAEADEITGKDEVNKYIDKLQREKTPNFVDFIKRSVNDALEEFRGDSTLDARSIDRAIIRKMKRYADNGVYYTFFQD